MTYCRGRLSSLLLGALGIASLGGAGCGGVTAAAVTPDGGDAPIEAAPATTEEGCNRVANSLCDALFGCAPTALKVLYGDKATCVSRGVLSCKTDQSVPGIARTADDLVKCAQQLGVAACGDLLAGTFPDVCAVKAGTTVNGMACGSDWQCESTYCRKLDAKCGVCGPRAAASGDCTVDGGCQKGLVCANKKCAMPGGPGTDCNLPNQPCRTDLYCTSANGSGKCAAKVGAGGACADNSDACDFVKGVVCNPINHTCETISVAKGGEACGLGMKTICVGFLAPCSPNIIGGGVCANPADDGATCGGKDVCIPPANCVSGVCQLPSAPECK